MPMINFPQIEEAYFYILEEGNFSQFFDIREAFGYQSIPATDQFWA